MLELQYEKPLTPNDLIGNTRENQRDLKDYNLVLSRLGMPKLESFGEPRRILEIGTGQGKALHGFLNLSDQNSHLVSIDIDRKTIENIASKDSSLKRENIHLSVIDNCKVGKTDLNLAERNIVELYPVDGAQALLPPNYFDFAVSIWVLYQVEDKIRTIANVMNSLKEGGRFVIASGGSICVLTESDFAKIDIPTAQEFVWNRRHSKFSWLTGTRELKSFLDNMSSHNHQILPIGGAVEKYLNGKVQNFPATNPEQPDGHCIIQKCSDGKVTDLQYRGYVSTRNSALVPLYTTKDLV